MLLGIVVLLALASASAADAQPKGAALAPFTGHWKGPFVAHTYASEQVDSLTAEPRYRWEAEVQLGTQIDRSPYGRVVRHTARNSVRNDTLFCEVMYADGSTAA